MKAKKTKKFTVLISRISYSSKNIEVEASNKKEAKEKALEIAYNFEFSEHDADYLIDAIEEK